MVCNICPRQCNVDRDARKGFCGMGNKPVVARAFLHMWEEPCISGTNGSGTVFFSGCSLKCIFCQNHEISHGRKGKEISVEELSRIFLSLQDKGAHNINLVTPTQFVPAIREALDIARSSQRPREEGLAQEALRIPVVYNTNGYDNIEALRMLEGSVDIYLPDLKYVSPDISFEYSGASDYFDKASVAILEMQRQAGSPVFDENGLMKRGMIIRHLVLPGHVNETLRILDWISENLPSDTYVSLMSQFTPCHQACGHPTLGRRLTRYEYEKVTGRFAKLGLNGFIQERESASSLYIPDFSQVKF